MNEQPHSEDKGRNPNEEPSFPGEGIFDFAMNEFQDFPDHGSPKILNLCMGCNENHRFVIQGVQFIY